MLERSAYGYIDAPVSGSWDFRDMDDFFCCEKEYFRPESGSVARY